MDTMLCDGQMVMYKLEAAEAMASNSTVRGGALGSRRQSQRGKTEISSLEAEKEAQRRHRIFANREFARKTTRRREAIYAELNINRKAANMSLERENLNKEKEMVVKEHDHLKNINECLKAKVAKIEAEEAEFDKELKKSVQVSISKPTNILTFPYNYPSVSPYLWPAIVPPSDNAFGIQGSSHSDITISSQFPIPLRDGRLGSFQDQEHATQINKQGTSLLVVPLPRLSPFHSASTTLHSMIGPNSNPSCSETGTHSDQNYELTSSQKMKSEASNSMENIATNHLMPSRQSFTKSVTSPGPSKSSQLYNTKVEAVPSATRRAAQDLSAKYHKPVILSSKKPGNANASAVARRRRKELIKLSNTHFHPKGSRVMLE